MKKKLAKNKSAKKKYFTIGVVVAVILLIVGAKSYIDSTRGDPHTNVLAKVKGNPQARLQIVEFIDFQCPPCATGAKYLKRIMDDHPDLIRLELKHFPSPSHKHAYQSARYSECAARQGSVWPFAELLIQRQQQWEGLADATDVFDLMAIELDLNKKELDACLQGQNPQDAIEANRREGQALSVTSTPTYFINGKMVVGPKSLEAELAPYLEGKRD